MLSVVTAAVLCCSNGPPVRSAIVADLQARDTTELLRLERVWNEAHLRGDAIALDSLWAPDLEVVVPAMLPISRQEALAFARSDRMRFYRYESSELRFRMYGSTAVVSGRLQRTRTLDRRTISDDWHFLKVYVRADGRWRVVAFQASTVPGG